MQCVMKSAEKKQQKMLRQNAAASGLKHSRNRSVTNRPKCQENAQSKASEVKGTKGKICRSRQKSSNRHPSKQSKTEIWVCAVCKVEYGDKSDKLSSDDWFPCVLCTKKFHQSCAEAYGIVDDDDSFTCKECV